MGGVGVALGGDPDVESPQIIERLSRFRLQRPPDLVLELSATGRAPGQFCAEPFAEVLVEGDIVTAARDDFRLEADLAAGHGTLVLTRGCGALPGVLRVLFSRLLPMRRSAILVHGAGVVRGDLAWAFIGESGAGKSTVAGQLNGWPVLSDELIVLGSGGASHTDAGRVLPVACGTPFSSKPEYPGTEACEALGGIFAISKGDTVAQRRLEPHEAVAALLERVVVPGDAGTLADRLVEIALALARAVGVTALTLPGPPAAREFFAALGDQPRA